MIVTRVPRLTRPPPGFWASTLPSSAGLLTGWTAPTTGVSPASARAVSALDSFWPTVFGTVTCVGWRATVIVTVEPGPTRLPATGSWASTVPGSCVVESCETIDTFRPLLASSTEAESWLWPTTAGTVTRRGPEETNSVTALSLSIWVPVGGTVRVAMPAGMLSDASRLTLTLKPSACSFLRACDCVRPSTLGTIACPGPPETVSETVEPLSALVPGCGS